MMYGNGWGWGWMLLITLLWIALLALLILAAVRLVRPTGGRGFGAAELDQTPRRETPQEILDRRFASGEIDAEAYTRARDQLAGKQPGSS